MSIKASVARLLGPANVRRVNALLGRSHFDEVTLVHHVFHRLGRPGVMIDVGAHHGVEAAMFAADGWRVLAFEPDDKNRAYLEQVVGKWDKVTIDKRAVSNKAGVDLPFFASDVSTGISSLSAFHESHEQRQTVTTTTIADAMSDYSLPALDFLKIDTEGFDLFVLRGIDWARPPGVIVCEFEDRKTVPLGYSVADMHALLIGQGYQVTISEWEPIVEYGRRHQWKRFTHDVGTIAPAGWGNLIAFHDAERFADLSAGRIERLKTALL